MKVIGIIGEYNPLHNGHLYHIEKTKEMFPDSLIILVLNGYFLERGEMSLLTKEAKITAALTYGVDLVLELPVIFGSQSADIFAQNAIEILANFKVSDIVFGSESDDIDLLINMAKLQLNPKFDAQLKEILKTGINYPTALSKAMNLNKIIKDPNDLLGISYAKAILKNKYPITLHTIKRTNEYHDLQSNENIISASNIRNKIKNNENISLYLPKQVSEYILPIDNSLLFKLIKSKILSTPNLEQFLTVDEGIENRIISATLNSQTLDELIKAIKTKRYTYNKINRMLIHILLGITKKDNEKANLDYIRVLGFNDHGQKYLNSIKKDLIIPTNINKDSIIYKYEITASLIFDLINNTNTYSFEKSNNPIKKSL